MAKELPYFKFEPSEWDSGNIQMCSRESKGLFMDMCSIYWNRLGELPYALALQKLCNGSKDAMQELIEHDIIGVIDNQIVIEFLDEQLSEFQETSEKRRNAANKRWKDASALQVQSKSNAIREEKKREEKIKVEDNYSSGQEAFDEIKNDELFIERLLILLVNTGNKYADKITVMNNVKRFLSIESAKDDFSYRSKSEVKQHLVNWINKTSVNGQQA